MCKLDIYGEKNIIRNELQYSVNKYVSVQAAPVIKEKKILVERKTTQEKKQQQI